MNERGTFLFAVNKNKCTVKHMATDRRRQNCYRKLPVQLREEVIETARTDWRAYWWWWKSTHKNDIITYFSLEPILFKCDCVHVWHPRGERSSAGVLVDNHTSDVTVTETATVTAACSISTGMTEHFLIYVSMCGFRVWMTSAIRPPIKIQAIYRHLA